MEIGYNTHRVSDGKAMGRAGMVGSFTAYLQQAMKGHMVDGVSPMTEIRKRGEFFALAGGGTLVWVHHINGDQYRLSIRRPEGRGGIAIGKEVSEKVGTFSCPTDPAEFIANIPNNKGQTLTIVAGA